MIWFKTLRLITKANYSRWLIDIKQLKIKSRKPKALYRMSIVKMLCIIRLWRCWLLYRRYWKRRAAWKHSLVTIIKNFSRSHKRLPVKLKASRQKSTTPWILATTSLKMWLLIKIQTRVKSGSKTTKTCGIWFAKPRPTKDKIC